MFNPYPHPNNCHGYPQYATAGAPAFQPCKRFGLHPFTNNPNEMQTWPEDGYSKALSPYQYEFSGGRFIQRDTMIIAVDGTCRQNGQYGAEAAYGVYVNDRSAYNDFARLPPWVTQPTNQKAELWAGFRGIMTGIGIARTEDLVARFQEENERQGGLMREPYLTIIIKSDSEYLVKGMTDWIARWHSNGWRTSNGAPVENRELFEQVKNAVVEARNEGIDVQFWHVGREFNQGADRLANRPFLR